MVYHCQGKYLVESICLTTFGDNLLVLWFQLEGAQDLGLEEGGGFDRVRQVEGLRDGLGQNLLQDSAGRTALLQGVGRHL